MLNFLLGRSSGCQELQSLVDHLTVANEKMAARGKSAQKVGDTLMALIHSEAPSFAVFFEKIQEIYTKLSRNYETAAKEQARAIEDLRDIVVRTPVFQRITSERETAKKNYDVAHGKYRDAKFRCKNQPTQESTMAFRSCRIERAQLAGILIEKTEQFLAYRTRFTRFVQNRSRCAWERYGRAIERASKVEAELMGQLAELCKRIRDNVDSPHLILKTAEEVAEDMRINDGELAGFGGMAVEVEAQEEEEEEGPSIDDDLILVTMPDE
jgi:HD superfamily phosphohydrolase